MNKPLLIEPEADLQEATFFAQIAIRSGGVANSMRARGLRVNLGKVSVAYNDLLIFPSSD